MSFFVWVKYAELQAVEVGATACRNVGRLKELAKKEIGLEASLAAITLCISSTTDDGSVVLTVLTALHLGLSMAQLASQQNYSPNTALHPLTVQVLSTSSLHPSIGGPAKQPHPKRKERWEQLNEILLTNKKQSKTTETTAYSYVSWNDIKSVFKTSPFTSILSPKNIPDAAFKILSEYLLFASMCFGPVTSRKESQHMHFIAPIIVCVCYLFNGDVEIDVEEDLYGDVVKAHVHFAFVLRCGTIYMFAS